MSEAPKFKTRHVTLTMPLSGWFVKIVIRRLGLATVNLPTTFDNSIYTIYKDMKGDTNCRKIGTFWSFGV